MPSACRTLQCVAPRRGVTRSFSLSTTPRSPCDFFSSHLKCTFPSLQGFGLWVGIQHITPPPPPPPLPPPPPPPCTSHSSSVLYSSLCYIDSLLSIQAAFLSSNFSCAARGWCGGYWCWMSRVVTHFHFRNKLTENSETLMCSPLQLCLGYWLVQRMLRFYVLSTSAVKVGGRKAPAGNALRLK